MLPDVLNRIEKAAKAAARNPSEIKLVAVTKTHNLERIKSAILAYGHNVVGENRIQEALPKLEALPQLEWHLIGHLQSNKVKFCQGFTLIHSIDSSKLLAELHKRAQSWQRTPELLLEVNNGFEAQKHGVQEQELPELLALAQDLGLGVRGLMTVAPQDPQQAKATFAMLAKLRDRYQLEHLSMGMSDDLEFAIEAGATIVRVGRACFS
ncbi:MAG: YggS family pyridoxal phosphate-dependent enzyme [Deinococcales bacterium]